MLTLTATAADVVKSITASATQATGAGLRISRQDGDPENFGLAAVESPLPGDQVVENNGARVFLDAPAADALDNEVLDAQVDPSGGVQFALAGPG